VLKTTPQGTVPGKGEGKEENEGRHYPTGLVFGTSLMVAGG